MSHPAVGEDQPVNSNDFSGGGDPTVDAGAVATARLTATGTVLRWRGGASVVLRAKGGTPVELRRRDAPPSP